MEIPGLLQPSSLSEVPTVKDPDVASSLPNILSLTISTARLKNSESCGASCSMFTGPQHGATVANIVLGDYTKQEYQNTTRKTQILKEFKVKLSRLDFGVAYCYTIFLCCLGFEIDDQHRNPNINNKDHHVGQLTTLVETGKF